MFRDFHASVDPQWNQTMQLMLENPHEKDTHQETLDRLAEQYRKYPTAIASAEPAEPDGYTQFGFVEYPVAFPVTIAKVAKKAKKPKKNRA